eukprot:gene16961-27192_t
MVKVSASGGDTRNGGFTLKSFQNTALTTHVVGCVQNTALDPNSKTGRQIDRIMSEEALRDEVQRR